LGRHYAVTPTPRTALPGLLDNIMAVINSDAELRQWFQINARSDGPLDWPDTIA
jgi:hypothetical protein